MRIAIISDLHANAPALDAVLTHAALYGANHTLCLGDIVGYHAMPRETIARLRDRQILSIRGNHDLAVLGELPDDDASPLARNAVAWTREALTPSDRDYLRQLPNALSQCRRILCVHAAPGDTQRSLRRDEDFRDVAQTVRAQYPDVEICLTGHTHQQGLVRVAADGAVSHAVLPQTRITPGGVTFINPGSVGRPLDGDPRAAYATLDLITGAVTFWRVTYDQRMVDAADAAAGFTDTATPLGGVRQRLSSIVKALQWTGA